MREHEELIDAIADGRADDADAVARAHVGIDVELISSAMRRAGVFADWTPVLMIVDVERVISAA